MSRSDENITLSGRVADGHGIALWQADGSGPEPAATGHSFVTPIETITAHYYVASRDHVDPAARAGLAAQALAGPWTEVRAALTRAGFALERLTMRLPLTTAGADRENIDWFYRAGVETRYMRPSGPLPLMLEDHVLLEFAPPRLTLTEDYRGARHFAEVRIALVSDATRAHAPVAALAGRYADLVRAFLADLNGRNVRFVVERIQLTPQTFSGQGRTSGCLAEIPTARVEVVS